MLTESEKSYIGPRALVHSDQGSQSNEHLPVQPPTESLNIPSLKETAKKHLGEYAAHGLVNMPDGTFESKEVIEASKARGEDQAAGAYDNGSRY
ncbi:MAG: hypothetical protein JWS12_462 [Candidatus Saccharibacteria bacterium]|nr:hypothetical protein [Candidatus Saccharibacteria bacterium]